MGNGEWEDLWDVGCGQGESGKWNGRRGKRREWGVEWKAREEERVESGVWDGRRGKRREWNVGCGLFAVGWKVERVGIGDWM